MNMCRRVTWAFQNRVFSAAGAAARACCADTSRSQTVPVVAAASGVGSAGSSGSCSGDTEHCGSDTA